MIGTAISPAAAETKYELTPFVGYRAGGEFEDFLLGTDLEINQSSSYGLILDIPLGGGSQLEILWSRQSTELDAGGPLVSQPLFDIDIDYLHVGGVYNWGYEEDKIRPFLLGTLGVTILSPEPSSLDSETNFSAGFGGGVKVFASDHIGFRFEGRGYLTFLDSTGSGVFCGPSGCLVAVSSDVLGQFEGRAGLIITF
jgi:hypothetical protein